jgi:hypothetical protein
MPVDGGSGLDCSSGVISGLGVANVRYPIVTFCAIPQISTCELITTRMIAKVLKQRAAYLPALLFAGMHVASFALFRLPQLTISADRSPFSHTIMAIPQATGDSSYERVKRSNGSRLKKSRVRRGRSSGRWSLAYAGNMCLRYQ